MSTTQNPRPPVLPPGSPPYYGYEAIATMAAKFMMAHFATTTATDNYPVPSQDEVQRDLARFIAFALYHGQLPERVLYYALCLLGKYAALDREARRDPSVYALFIAAYNLASHTLSTKDKKKRSFWLALAQDRFSDMDLDKLCQEFSAVLDGDLYIPPSEMHAFRRDTIDYYGL